MYRRTTGTLPYRILIPLFGLRDRATRRDNEYACGIRGSLIVDRSRRRSRVPKDNRHIAVSNLDPSFRITRSATRRDNEYACGIRGSLIVDRSRRRRRVPKDNGHIAVSNLDPSFRITRSATRRDNEYACGIRGSLIVDRSRRRSRAPKDNGHVAVSNLSPSIRITSMSAALNPQSCVIPPQQHKITSKQRSGDAGARSTYSSTCRRLRVVWEPAVNLKAG